MRQNTNVCGNWLSLVSPERVSTATCCSQDLDVLAAHLNQLGAEIRPPARTVLLAEDISSDEDEEDEDEEEVGAGDRDGTLPASEPARPL